MPLELKTEYPPVPRHCVRISGSGRERTFQLMNTDDSASWLRKINKVYENERRRFADQPQRPGSEFESDMLCLRTLIDRLGLFDQVSPTKLLFRLKSQHDTLNLPSFEFACRAVFGKLLQP